MKRYYVVLMAIFSLNLACTNRTEDDLVNVVPNSLVKYNEKVKPIITQNCIVCHGGANTFANLDLTTNTNVKNAILNRGLLLRINDSSDPMPQSGLMNTTNRTTISKWQIDGFLD